jgi:hypothetical protein
VECRFNGSPEGQSGQGPAFQGTGPDEQSALFCNGATATTRFDGTDQFIQGEEGLESTRSGKNGGNGNGSRF